LLSSIIYFSLILILTPDKGLEKLKDNHHMIDRKVALVTGAASGLGFEFSLILAGDSFDLVLVDRDVDGLEKAKDELEKRHGIRVDTLVEDMGTAGAALSIYQKLENRDIDILVNNAGFGMYGFFSDTDWKMEESMIHLHVLTLTHLTKLVLGDMIRRKSGRILNVSSMAAFQPGPLMSVYYATKAYILSFSEALANEVKGTGVSVTVLAPGWFRTNFQKTIAVRSGVPESTAKLHTVTVEIVARRAYRAMLRGRTLVVPGFNNKIISELYRVLPRKTQTFAVRMIQERLRKQTGIREDASTVKV
jgi:uncharacterized protein